MLVLESPSNFCLLRPKFGLTGTFEEPPGDTARFARLRVFMRSRSEEAILSSLEPEVRNAGEEAWESETFLRTPLPFRVDLVGT